MSHDAQSMKAGGKVSLVLQLPSSVSDPVRIGLVRVTVIAAPADAVAEPTAAWGTSDNILAKQGSIEAVLATQEFEI